MSIKEQVKALWRLCFEDTEEFVELYFRMRYADGLNYTIGKDGKVIAALQAIPYTMTYGGRQLPVSYISGACTHPDYRNQGAMRELLTKVHRCMYGEGICFSTLIPAEEWLKGYYARSGYAVCFRYGLERTVINNLLQPVDNSGTLWNLCKVEPHSPDFVSAYSFFNAQMQLRSCCIQHTSDDFEVILADLSLSGGACWMVKEGERLCGVICCVPHVHHVEVKEMLLVAGASSDAALALLAAQYGKDTIETITPSSATHELGMARVIHAEACLRLYAQMHPQDAHTLYVYGDEGIPENNGCYRIEGGMCRRLSETPSTCTVYTIPELTRWLLRGETPYMSLMLN